MFDRFILLAMTPVTLATGAYGWASAAVAEAGTTPDGAGPVADPEKTAVAGVRGSANNGRLILSDTDGLFRVIARFDGQPVEMVVDTGANVTVLSPRDAARLGINARSANGAGGTMRTAGGEMRYRRVTINQIRIGDQLISGARIAVVSGSLHQSLLGQDIIRQLGPITFDGDRLSLN